MLVLLMLVSCGKAPPVTSEAPSSPVTQSPSSTPSVAASPSPTPSVSPSPTHDPRTANWQTYQSMKGQFTLKHPATWYLSPESVNGSLVGIGMGVQHSVGSEGYVTDIGVGSWPVSDQIDTSCFLLIGPSDSQPATIQGVSGVRHTGTFAECQGGQQSP